MQRVVVRAHRDRGSYSARSIIGKMEVDEMTSLLEAKGGPAIDLFENAPITIGAGEHYFSGHGLLNEFAGLSVDQFLERVKFAVPDGEQAYVHLYACNVGGYAEPLAFANELRKRLSADSSPYRAMNIVVVGASAYLYHTKSVKANIPQRDIKEAFAELVAAEDKADLEVAMALAGTVKTKISGYPMPSAEKILRKYGGWVDPDVGLAAWANDWTGYERSEKLYRKSFFDWIDKHATGNPSNFFKAVRGLKDVFPHLNMSGDAEEALGELRARSVVIWEEYQGKLQKKLQDIGPLPAETLSPFDKKLRRDVRERFDRKEMDTRRRYAWITYPTRAAKEKAGQNVNTQP